jgi:hypothetical protein
MWLCTSSGFISIVADRHSTTHLLVRARVAGHIEATFPDAMVFTNDDADYRYRAVIPREKVAEVVAQSVKNIQYDNFKSSVTNHSLHDSYTSVWWLMRQLQEAA